MISVVVYEGQVGWIGKCLVFGLAERGKCDLMCSVLCGYVCVLQIMVMCIEYDHWV